jgi:hypothetical protein
MRWTQQPSRSASAAGDSPDRSIAVFAATPGGCVALTDPLTGPRDSRSRERCGRPQRVPAGSRDGRRASAFAGWPRTTAIAREASAGYPAGRTTACRPKQASQHPSGDARSRAESERDALRREQHHLDRRCPDDRLFRHRELLKQMLDLAPRRATAAWSATASGSSRAPCPAAPSYSASWAARPATAPTCARRTRRSRAGSTPRRTQPRWSSRYSIGVTVDRKGTLETVDEPAAR